MMEKYDYPISNQTRLFLAGLKAGDEKFIYGVLPWRIMWNGGSERVILREYLKHSETWLYNFPDNCNLDLLGGEWGLNINESRYEGIWLYRFENCGLRRFWITEAGAFGPDEMTQLFLWAEIECTIFEMMTNYEVK